MSHKLFHVIDSLGIGGAQVMMFELYHALNKLDPNFEQKIFLLNKSQTNDKFVSQYGCDYEFTTTNDLIKKTKKSDIQPVVIYHKLMRSNVLWLRGLHNVAPVILVNHTHSNNLSYNRIRHVNHVVAVCENMKHNLNKLKISKPISTIYNSVDHERFDKIEPIDRNENEYCLVTGRVNALNKIKYSDSWINWCASVDLPKPLIHEYIGGGSYIKNARKLANNSNSKNEVRMFGPESRFDRKVARIKSWDIFLYEINRHEGLSMSVLESLACGTPVICSNHKGNNEIIEDGVNGYIYRNRDELESILTELSLNDDLISELQESTYKHFVDKLDARVAAQKYRKIINNVKANFGSDNNSKHTAKKPSDDKIKNKRKQIRQNQHKPTIRSKRRQRVRVNDKQKSRKQKNKRHRMSGEKQKKEDNQHLVTADDNDKFTILTSSHNNVTYLDAWSESILRQSYRPLEVVFVDDANKDGTAKKIHELKPQFDEQNIDLKIVHNKKRLHCASSYQAGFNEATGYFMGVLDSDDMLTPQAVEYIMSLYKEKPEIGWIYTQFDICDKKMKPRKKGFCRAPAHGESLLDLGKRGKHSYSHWRTFSRRVPKLEKIWNPGLTCAVDKYMAYRLEEWSKGMFVNTVCYKYREGVKKSISDQGKSKQVWRDIIKDAEKRRKRYKLEPHKIIEYK